MAALLLILEALTVTTAVIILGKYFHFPDVLRQPAHVAFELFKAHGEMVRPGYYAFLISALIYIPLSISLKNKFLLHQGNKTMADMLLATGVATAIFQSVGFVRWIFIMPYLTGTYFRNPEHRVVAAVIYETMNRYAGLSIGEHLGFLAMGSWTLILAAFLSKDDGLRKWLGFTGMLIGALMLISVLEHFGGANAASFGFLNFLANAAWTVWITALAISLIFDNKETEDYNQ